MSVGAALRRGTNERAFCASYLHFGAWNSRRLIRQAGFGLLKFVSFEIVLFQ